MNDLLPDVLGDLTRRRQELTDLLARLVQAHPIYESPGQDDALRLAAEHLVGSGLDVQFSEASLDVLMSSPLYVDVPAFGGDFESYGRVPRTALTATRVFDSPGCHVILNGHLDVEYVTAPGDWFEPGLWSSGAVRDGRIYGRGTSDMLGGVACYLHVLRSLAPHLERAEGAVSVQLVLDEEIGGNGTLWQLLRSQGAPADLAIIAEPSDGVACARTRGFHQFKVVCFGAPVHMVFAREHDNAVRTAADVLRILEDLNCWIAEQFPGSDARRFVLCGVIGGGTDAAVPAARVELLVTLALPPEIAPHTVERRLSEALFALGLAKTPVIERYGLSFPGSATTDHRFADALNEAGRRTGLPVGHGEFPSACDARLYDAFGVPVTVFGPGRLDRAHGSDEYVTLDELDDYCAVLAASLMHLWGIE
ncbi:M20 family metallopeptidase [Streptomyces anulatus]|uniref:M20 family metallopeptidase n=1 Tax=Streptomyces anulatus TaxID=1892 RepID=UPI0033DBA9AB|nr:M20/M25/M40 family metallo-hydrolase [Streptomyces anulatus]WSU32605.1 M20/M25/M40 family metallo-hydrolase [Streptomyces anulatus]WSU88544.1 M20/M25/M40 family metallo-hydrolase [Streptomyces anulatus]